MNSVNIIGNLTANPELRHTPAGAAVADFSVAINEKFKNSSGETVEKTHFVSVTAWGKLAEIVTEHKKQGDQVAVAGRLSQDRWEAEDGTKRQRLSVVADSVDFLQSKRQGQS